jgi:hypothetical protein
MSGFFAITRQDGNPIADQLLRKISPHLPKRAMFRLRMAGGSVTGPAYLTRLSLSPSQEE